MNMFPHAADAPSEVAVDAIGEDLLSNAIANSGQLVAWRHELHGIPEVGLHTTRTAAFISDRLSELGIAHQIEGSGCVVALIGSPAPDHCLLLRADMDGLPVVERSGEPWASTNGCSHSCGHDMHAASLLGAARLLKSRGDVISSLNGCVKLLFQPGEETFEGGRAAIDEDVLHSPKVDAAFAMHVNGRCPMGLMIYGDAEFAGVWGFRITIRGRGGHGSAPEKCNDPITAAVHIHLAISEVMSHEVAPGVEAVLSIGKFEGGSAANTIPDECVLEGTLRAYDSEIMGAIEGRVREVVDSTSRTYRVSVRVEDLSRVPPVVVDEAMTRDCLSYVGHALPEIRFRGIQHSLGAEDFAFFSSRVPSAYFTVGAAAKDCKEHFSMHDPRVRFDDDELSLGAASYAAVALGWLADACVRGEG